MQQKKDDKNKLKVFDACPHCGQKLSPWQQVLLSVDRALMCKNCWYRIIIDTFNQQDEIKTSSNGKSKEGN